MAISFHAGFVRAFRQDWGWHVVWAKDNEVSDELYLSLQRKHRYTLAEKIFGWSKVYIECCGQGWSWYGHIRSFELQRDRVKVQLDRKAARDMENDGRIEVTFESNAERFVELQGALNQVFRGYDYYKVAA